MVPTGTATPWREMPYTSIEPGERTYIRDGWVTESADLLAEALRADGVVRTLSQSLRVAESAVLQESWYGYVDGGFDEVICSDTGETADGEWVDGEAKPCVIAIVDTRD